MDNSINSISTILPQLLKLYNNAIESFERLTEAVTSTKDNINLNIISNDDTLKQLSVPSFGSMKSRIDVMEKNWESIAGSASTTSIRLPDGSFRKLVINQINGQPSDITDLSATGEFKTKSNYFLEKLMDPMMYIAIDVTGKVPIDIEDVQLSKFILDLDTTTKIDWFDNNYKGKSNISYVSFVKDLINNSVQYVLDERTLEVPPRTLRFSGKFNVLRTSDTTVTETVNNTQVVKNRKKFKLNTKRNNHSISVFKNKKNNEI